MSQFKFSTEARSASRTALRTKLLQENEACEGKVQLDNGDSINVQSLSISDLVKHMQAVGLDPLHYGAVDKLAPKAIAPKTAIVQPFTKTATAVSALSTNVQPVQQVQHVGRKPAAEIFKNPDLKGEVDMFAGAGQNLVTTYQFNPRVLQKLINLFNAPANSGIRALWLYGRKGAGKSTALEQFCCVTGRPYFAICCDENMSRLDFLGQKGMENASTVWQDGMLLIAIRTPYALIAFEEVSTANPADLAILHQVISAQGFITVPDTGERVDVAEGVRFCAADNTNGHGDTSGRYAGTKTMNDAFMDMYGWKVQVPTMDETTEAQIIAAQSGCKLTAAKELVRFANVLRDKHYDGSLPSLNPSLRSLIPWSIDMQMGTDARTAFEDALANSANEMDRETVQQLFVAENNVDKLNRLFGLEGDDVEAEMAVASKETTDLLADTDLD